MKKALVLALTVLMVLSLATAAFAVEVEYSGKVGVKWSNEAVDGAEGKVDGFAQDSLEAKVVLDFTKDYGDGVTAGVKTKTEAHGDMNKFEFDGGGWIQLERDLFTVKAATKLNDQVGKDMKEFKIEEKPGFNLKLNLIDGLTVDTILNAGSEYNYLVKGEFAQDLFTVGGGFQNNNKDDGKVQQAFGVYGSADIIDGLTLKAEYGNRNLDKDNESNKAISSILASAAYEVDALNVKGSFLMQDAEFKSAHKDDIEEVWRINGVYRWADDSSPRHNVNVIFADASYKLTDDFEVNGYFDYLLSVKDAEGNALPEAVEKEIEKVSYKAGAAYTIDALKLESWYRAYGDSQVAGKATYTLAEDVTTSFEVDYNMYKAENKDANVVYTAKVEAKF